MKEETVMLKRKGKPIEFVPLGEARAYWRQQAKGEWDKGNMAVVSTKLRRERLMAFRKHCEERGETPYARLLKLILQDLDG